MALITETGAVVVGAESFVSVTDTDLYHSNRANTAWAVLATPAKEAALRKATDYMLQMYRARWKGYRKDGTQTLDWPRSFVYLEPFVHGIVGTFPFLVPDTIVPVEVKNACSELALRASAGDLAPDIGQNVVSEKIDTIEVVYDKYSPAFVVFRSIDNMLAPYLIGNSNMVAINRV